MKKLLAVILSLMLMLSLTACGGGSANSGEGAIDGCFNAIKKLEFKEAFSYIEGGEDIELPFDNFDEAVKIVEDMLPALEDEAGVEIPDGIVDSAKKHVKTFVNDALDTISYKVVAEEEDGDEILLTLEVEVPDVESLEDSFTEEDMMEIVGDLSPNDLEDVKVLDRVLGDFVDYVVDVLKDADTITEELEILVVKDGGKYYISRDNEFLAGLDELEEALEEIGDISDLEPEELMELIENMM